MSFIKHITKLAVIVLMLLLLAAFGSGTSSNSEAASSGATTAVDGKINLNNMTEDQLMSTIPDFSSRMVREFFEYQPYVSIQQFRREIGKYVDEAQVSAYEQYVFVPVSVDESDAETLQQIPGLDESIAAELMDGRPYGSNEAFLAKLAEYLSAEQTAVAASYLQ
jgi:radical SAM superfamily enzyme with C-terminal helix-hairpin-helix motif